MSMAQRQAMGSPRRTVLQSNTTHGGSASDAGHPFTADRPPWDGQRSWPESPPDYAGFWRRFVAGCIDWLAVGIVAAITVALTGFDPQFQLTLWVGRVNLNFETNAGGLMAMVIAWPYLAGLESSSWQGAFGKRALGIRVTDLEGRRISFARATARYASRSLSLFALLIGYLIQPFTRKRQALHDVIAGTLVTRD